MAKPPWQHHRPIILLLLASHILAQIIPRLDRGKIAVQHATAYHFLGNPVRQHQTLWLHLPLNISSILDMPLRHFQLAALTLDTCDAANIRFHKLFPHKERSISGDDTNLTATPTLMTTFRPPTTKANKYHHYTMPLTGNYTLADARLACKSVGRFLPHVAFATERAPLMHFMQRNLVPSILLDVGSDGDGLNKFMSSNIPVATAFSKDKDLQKKVFQYVPKKAIWERAKNSIWTRRGRRDTQYSMNMGGHLEAYELPVDRHDNEDLFKRLFDKGLKRQNLYNFDYLPKTPVICETGPEKPAKSVSPINPESKQSFRDAVQLCYDTVEQAEFDGVQAELALQNIWAQHNLRVMPTTTPSRRRRKRLVGVGLSVLMSGILALNKARKFTTAVKPMIKYGTFLNAARKSRRSYKIMAKSTVGQKALKPILMGVNGIGQHAWTNYRTRQRFDEQTSIVKSEKEILEAHSRQLSTIVLQTQANTQGLSQIRTDMLMIERSMQNLASEMQLLAAASIMATSLVRVNRASSTLTRDFYVATHRLENILTKVQSRNMPGIFLTRIKEEIDRYDLQGEQVLPHPDKPVTALQIVNEGQVDLYAQFVVGDNSWELYHIYPLPRFNNARAYVRKAAFDFALVDTAQKKFIPLTQGEARKCQDSICPPTAVVRRVLSDPCTIRMLGMSPPDDDCPVDEQPNVPFLKATSDGLIYSVPALLVARLHCKDAKRLSKIGVDAPVELDGIGIIDIPIGCDFEINEPEVTVLGPPRLLNTTAEKPTQKKQTRGALTITKTAADMALLRASETISSQFKGNRASIQTMGYAAMGISLAVGLLITAACGKGAWLYHHNRAVHSRFQNAGEAIDVGFTSAAGFARDVFTFLNDREQFTAYIRGQIELPLRRHLSSLNINRERCRVQFEDNALEMEANLRNEEEEERSITVSSPAHR
jgi:hypothetical protein